MTLAPFKSTVQRRKSIYRLEASDARLKYYALKKRAVLMYFMQSSLY